MSECVVRMEMPAEHCMDCRYMVSRNNDDCILQSDEANERAESWEDLKAGCPFICALPENHGRLVDVNELEAIMFEDEGTTYKSGWNNGLRAAMQYLTTLVPAEAERSET